jgi:hypothetical protein
MSIIGSTTFWIQFLGVMFGGAMFYFTYIKFKRKEINHFEVWAWSIGWIILILTAIAPYSLDSIIAPLNFYRRLDFFVVIGFFVLLGLGFYNYSIVKKLDKKMEILVRKIAHKEANFTNPKKINQKTEEKKEEPTISD